jgi:hypothetical protein
MRPGEHETRWHFISIAAVRRKRPRLGGAGAEYRDDYAFRRSDQAVVALGFARRRTLRTISKIISVEL